MTVDMTNFLTPPPILTAKRALCVQPHADDNEIGMGGIVAALSARGCEVHYLTVTNGDLGLLTPELSHEQLAMLRRQEAEAAGRVLGVRGFHFWDEPDGSLRDIPALAERMALLMRDFQPEVVFCPDPWAAYEGHNDHVVTGRATAQAFLSAGLQRYPRGTHTMPWQPAAIGFYFTQQPNTVVDVTDAWEAKFAAMAEHHTQMNEELLGLYRAYFTQRGQQLAQGKGFALGEGLKVLGSIHLHCFAEAPLI